MTGLGPFDLNGPEFLLLYGELALIALVAGFLIPRYLRPEGRTGYRPNEDELALLAGGRERFAETVAVRLLSAGAASMQSDGMLQIRDQTGGGTVAERRVIALGSPVRWRDLLLAVTGPAENAEHKLSQRGLLMDPATLLQMRLLQTAPSALLFLFGAAKWGIGTLRDKPVGMLTALLAVTAVVAALRFAAVDRRTRAGKAALADARFAAARLRRATPNDETPLAVALFGTSVLIGLYLSDFHRMRSAGSGGDTTSSSGCSGGGGGCGGGGCGGCGS
ncbi:hypothetical protein NSE01_32030 [Novosphingobium sediminis]|uniref:TIGR04222 domain-containing membrane protein n=1 Tax=Novosphingobium sediminis TaxID=707214 RepID=A0A512ANW2_9SPHN|nr:TIGR04222 domain-containing membrane protein [Novosphingobium sediminis]GEO01371.1 hypothetical protein NSE01_32030 [Novosphingobium sediminis]